jgi:hypothetical protein
MKIPVGEAFPQGIGIRTYVDEMDANVNKTYAAMPTRLYLIGLDGRVVYAGGLGPFGFKPAALGTAIDEYLGREDMRVVLSAEE